MNQFTQNSNPTRENLEFRVWILHAERMLFLKVPRRFSVARLKPRVEESEESNRCDIFGADGHVVIGTLPTKGSHFEKGESP